MFTPWPMINPAVLFTVLLLRSQVASINPAACRFVMLFFSALAVDIFAWLSTSLALCLQSCLQVRSILHWLWPYWRYCYAHLGCNIIFADALVCLFIASLLCPCIHSQTKSQALQLLFCVASVHCFLWSFFIKLSLALFIATVASFCELTL